MRTHFAPAVWSGFRHRACAVHGHELLMHFEHDRLSLVCARCGFETPGWTLRSVQERVRRQIDAGRRAA